MTPLDAARRLQSTYGKAADHVWVDCSHATTQQEGEGCHQFASCHHAYPNRCGFMSHEHHHDGTPELMLPQIVAALEQGERFREAVTDAAGELDQGYHTSALVTLRAALHGQEPAAERCQKQDCVNPPGHTGWHSFVLLSESTRCQSKHKPAMLSKKVKCERPANHAGSHSAHDEMFKWEPAADATLG